MSIKYRDGYKYQLAEDYSHPVPWNHEVEMPFYRLRHGVLTVKAGYAWDGPSGPTVDTKTSMRASLVHDCLYQAISDNVLPYTARSAADRILKEICLDAGMNQWRAFIWHSVVEKFGGDYATAKKEIKEAP